MPEYKKEAFAFASNPSYEEMVLNSEVYQIWPSGEIFTNYEQYLERLYMYNQRDWTCKYTGKGQLTFEEAFASEEKARRSLESFPEAWKGPLLAFIQHSTASLDQISGQFLDFLKTNYIPGEDIKIDFDGKKMSGKVISSTNVPGSQELSYRVEIFSDDPDSSELIGEANVIGCASLSRDKQALNRATIKRYSKSAASRRNPFLPWFIPDDLAVKYGISTVLPPGVTSDMKPSPELGSSKQQKTFSKTNLAMTGAPGFLADELAVANQQDGTSFHHTFRSSSPPLPQFNFPCDDAQVPTEFIDSETEYPVMKPINQFISESSDLTRSLSIWSFCQTFASLLQLSPFSYDDWEEAIVCDDLTVDNNAVLEETMLALLSSLMKDRRNLTKAAFAERILSLALSFDLSASCSQKVTGKDTVAEDVMPMEVVEPSDDELKGDGPEIILSSDEEDGPFIKRPRAASTPKTRSLVLPSIDLKRHRWYESKAADNWHFVLASFLMEALEMVNQFIAVELESGGGSEKESDEDGIYEHGGNVNDETSSDEIEVSNTENDAEPETENRQPDNSTASAKRPSMKEVNLAKMHAFVHVFAPLVENLTGEGSKGLFQTFLKNLSFSDKLLVLEFLIHSHFDRESFKAFVEDCQEKLGELRKDRREIEVEVSRVSTEVSELEEKISNLKAENEEITAQLEADEDGDDSDDEIALSEDEEKKAIEDASETSAPVPVAPREPLTEVERENLFSQRTKNKKEVASLNASLRRLRPELTMLSRRSEHIYREFRKVSSFRSECLGHDRQLRSYWWFGNFFHPIGRILIAAEPAEGNSDRQWLGCIDSLESFDGLMQWLNPLGIREAKLKANLLEIDSDLRSSLKERDFPDHLKEPEESLAADDVFDDESGGLADDSSTSKFGKRGRGRPKGGFKRPAPANDLRPFQRYKNAM